MCFASIDVAFYVLFGESIYFLHNIISYKLVLFPLLSVLAQLNCILRSYLRVVKFHSLEPKATTLAPDSAVTAHIDN